MSSADLEPLEHAPDDGDVVLTEEQMEAVDETWESLS